MNTRREWAEEEAETLADPFADGFACGHSCELSRNGAGREILGETLRFEAHKRVFSDRQ